MRLGGLVRSLDRSVFHGGLRRVMELRYSRLARHQLPQALHGYSRQEVNLLADLCDMHGSDKGTRRSSGGPYRTIPHNYADFYSLLFRHCRQQVSAVFECGIGTNNTDTESHMGETGRPGASLRVWRDYFPNAAIVGADIDRRVLFKEERIDTFFVDQTDEQSIRSLWDRVTTAEFDLMIDDGLHTAQAGMTFLRNSLHKLRHDGIYIIEDVHPKHFDEYTSFFLDKRLDAQIFLLRRSNRPLGDNCLIMVRHGEAQEKTQPLHWP